MNSHSVFFIELERETLRQEDLDQFIERIHKFSADTGLNLRVTSCEDGDWNKVPPGLRSKADEFHNTRRIYYTELYRLRKLTLEIYPNLMAKFDKAREILREAINDPNLDQTSKEKIKEMVPLAGMHYYIETKTDTLSSIYLVIKFVKNIWITVRQTKTKKTAAADVEVRNQFLD